MIDLRSDTVTQPSETMREAAATAEVGDDVYGEDPTVNALQDQAAELLGLDAALFCPSGTMANQIAVRTHTERGQELLLEGHSHLYRAELGGAAQLSGLQTRTIDATPHGKISPSDVEANYVEATDHQAGTGLLAIENTHNSHGGRVIAPEAIDAAATTAHELDVPVHLDGARLPNAAVAAEVPIDQFTQRVDSVMVSLSKGLGSPVGSVLAGSTEFIDTAHRHRKLFGGGMRQAGVIAAPGLVALENIDRLADDHANADRLADGLAVLEGLDVTAPDTNIVMVNTRGLEQTATEVISTLSDAGVGASHFGEYRLRFVTHRDVNKDDIDTAIDRIHAALA